jgi:hypothetical protein
MFLVLMVDASRSLSSPPREPIVDIFCFNGEYFWISDTAS